MGFDSQIQDRMLVVVHRSLDVDPRLFIFQSCLFLFTSVKALKEFGPAVGLQKDNDYRVLDGWETIVQELKRAKTQGATFVTIDPAGKKAKAGPIDDLIRQIEEKVPLIDVKKLRAELHKRLDNIDQVFQASAVQVNHRSWLALRELAKQTDLFPNGVPFGKIEWDIVDRYFRDKYSASGIHFERFEVPYLFEGEVYFYRIPILINVTNQAMSEYDPTTCLDAPPQVKKRLAENGQSLSEFAEDFQRHLGTDRIFSDRRSFPGINDYRSAIDDFRGGRLNQAAWGVVQCCEKAMKAFLGNDGITEKERRALSHHLDKIYERAVKYEPSLDTIKGDVDCCNEPNVDFRYQEKAVFSRLEVYKKLRAALSVWAACNDVNHYAKTDAVVDLKLDDGELKKRCVGKGFEKATPEEAAKFLRSMGLEASVEEGVDKPPAGPP
jgi:HEPN domain-containing protein